MIKENKKNKIITFLCACLMVCASALGLVSAVGTTLASSALFPTITVDSFNYKQENFLNNFDDIFTSVNIQTSSATSGSNRWDFTLKYGNVITTSYQPDSWYMFFLNDDNTVTQWTYSSASDTGIISVNFYNDGTVSFLNNRSYLNKLPFKLFTQPTILVFEIDYINYTICNNILYREHIAWSSSDSSGSYDSGYNAGYTEGQTAGVTQGQNNVINNPNNYNLYTEQQYQQNYLNGQNSVINNPSAYGLYTRSEYDTNYINGYTAGQQYGYNLGYTEGQQDGYNLGYVDGEHSSGGYQNGFNAGFIEGQQDVLNNPNLHGLYTQAQYEQNYINGYNQGVLNSQYGILSNVVISGLVDVNSNVNGINNNDFNFNAGTITPNSSLLNKLNAIFNSSPDVPAYAQIKFTLNEQYIYTRDNVVNFVNLSLLPNQTSYLPVTYITNSNQSIALIYSFNPIVENNVFTGYNVGIVGDDTPLLNNTIESFVINYAISDYNGLVLTRENLVKPQALSIFATSVLFDNGYNLGYIDGSSSNVVNSAYDRGVVDGFNSGYAQGLANQNNATFASMISAVIDVPINAMRNLFNFDLLGINLFGFFTALFTLLVVITIIRLILGGK